MTKSKRSSAEPSIQNIPVRSGVGRAIREAFVLQAKSALVGMDFADLELRVMAMRNEPGFKDFSDAAEMYQPDVQPEDKL